MANLPSLEPTTFADMMQFATMLAKSTMIPREYQSQPANIALAIGWGRELGLGAIQSLNAIAIINGKPSIYGDALLALVRGSPLCEDVIEAIKGEGDLATAVCEARRRGAEPVVRAFSVHDAKKAGLWDKAIWKQYPLRMLQMRARGFAIRDAFPDLLRGIISAEEAADIPREPKDITPNPAVLAADLDAFAAAEIEPDQTETDMLLTAAFVHAKDGMTTFRTWYLGLDDDQRLYLRPHIKMLQEEAARNSPAPDDPAQPSGGDLSGAATRPPEVTPPAATRHRRRGRQEEPTEEEIERSQEALAAVLGPEVIAELDEVESINPDPSVLVPFDAAGSVQEWFGRARTRLREMQEARFTPDRFVAYRKANAGALMRLRSEFASYADQLDQIIAGGERGGPALGHVRPE